MLGYNWITDQFRRGLDMEFRKMRRFKQQLSEDECKALLADVKRGVLAVNGDGGYPYALPINFWYDAESGKIYFHCAKEGHKIDALRADPRASFCIRDEGAKITGDWSYKLNSVIAFGKVSFVTDNEKKMAKLKEFGKKYYPTEEEVVAEIAKDGNRVEVLEFEIEHITGKRVHEK